MQKTGDGMGCEVFLPTGSSRDFCQALMTKHPKMRLPLFGQWELTYRCNLRCIHCYTDVYNHPRYFQKELQTWEILRILDELRKAGCLWLCLTGGEALMREDFFEIYRTAKEKGFLLILHTNGTLITEKAADFLKDYPPLLVEITLHATKAELFEKITQRKGSFGKVLQGIESLLQRNISLVLKVVGLTLNRDEILKVRTFVKQLGGVQFKFGEGLRDRLDGREDVYTYQLSEEELKVIEEEDPEMLQERELRLRDAEPPVCEAGIFTFHIDAFGQLQLCSRVRTKSYDLRKGSFDEGFYRYLHAFPCPFPRKMAAFEKEGMVSAEAAVAASP
ncbi:MAG: radical SAM protein [Candidatus Omnitrophota bacterium]